MSFHETRMGQRFFESTMPRLVEELARLNANLEAAAKRAEEAERRAVPTINVKAEVSK